MPAEQAVDLVTDVVEAVWPVGLVVKRIDTTLRGNIGAEVAAAWQALRDRYPPQARLRVLLVPAFPSAGRTTVDGVQHVDGTPLDRTELVTDPLSPVTTGNVAAVFAKQSGLAVRHVPVRRITQELLAAELAAGDEPIVLCDALTEPYLVDLAAAAAQAHREHGVVWLVADPGPAGALLAEALGLHGRGHSAGPLLAVVGSTTDLTRRQLDAVTRTGPVRFVDADVKALTDREGAHRDERVRALADALTSHAFPDVVALRLSESAEEVAALPIQQRRALPRLLAGLVARAVDDAQRQAGPAGKPSGLFVTGSDVTSAVLDALGVHAFHVGGEVLPLAVHGVLSGGPLDGAPTVIKGGLVGDGTAVLECFGRLRRAVQARLRTVRAEVPEHFLFAVEAPDRERSWPR